MFHFRARTGIRMPTIQKDKLISGMPVLGIDTTYRTDQLDYTDRTKAILKTHDKRQVSDVAK